MEQVAVEMWERYVKGIRRGCRKEIRPSLIHDEIGRDIVTTEQYIEKYGEGKLNELLEKAARPKIYRKNKIRNLHVSAKNKPVIMAYHNPAARLNSFLKRNQIPSSPNKISHKVPYQGANVFRAPNQGFFYQQPTSTTFQRPIQKSREQYPVFAEQNPYAMNWQENDWSRQQQPYQGSQMQPSRGRGGGARGR